ncbi:peptidase domain-containing ABC transporter [Spirosoma oryzicola]|uniref:peptidase domain-containing ABC transporter n=1 Tax=Spirosoma oryzicola TaxID=2898794 RepID=UPI001E38D520|nr:peptidase domain-containing ABC transporter [Spirosoma oryzicola]UHG94937.1 peptidase domain-containing ABC transporter [Spirosoma oryzicola]
MLFPHYRQLDAMDCGPTCLRMISRFYGRTYTLNTLRNFTKYSRDGVSLLGISKAAESIGFRTMGTVLSIDKLVTEEIPLPCIAHWDQNHFVVVHKVKKDKIFVADPGRSLITYKQQEFAQHWTSTQKNGVGQGVVLLLEPTPRFYEQDGESETRLGLQKLYSYLLSYKKLLLQLLVGLIVGSLLQLIFPFLTKSIVDVGINTHNLSFIYLVLGGQLMLALGQTSLDFIRGWILLHISTRIRLAILSDFLVKLMRLPLSFFDTKMTGDIMQRMSDHNRIEAFLTNTTLNTLFSLVNLLVFGGVLLAYSVPIFAVFIIGSLLYAAWVVIFLRYRKKLDYKRFAISTQNQNQIMQLVSGIHEIKLNDCGTQKIWEWERVQARFLRLNTQSLALNQNQQVGAFFINQGKNIVVIFLAAKAVLQGQLSLGEMLAVQYIIGQLNSPIEQLIQLMQVTQDAKLSMDRLNDIHMVPDEEPDGKPLMHYLPERQDIILRNVSFAYPGAGNVPVLKHINLTIPEGRTTAIVGTSGSGKTTVLKLLLRMYEPDGGEIRVGEQHFGSISHQFWRRKCGVVMQEGFIFSDTIARNIAIGDESIDHLRLAHAIKVANLQQFIEDAPLGYNVKIGAEGNGISQGQKQRILIARSVYKQPDYIFFDEATSALDANNEKVIMGNLEQFFQGRTVVVVAHRLSTVRHADKIVVLHRGEVVEEGTHEELVGNRAHYYELVKNQLELGN